MSKAAGAIVFGDSPKSRMETSGADPTCEARSNLITQDLAKDKPGRIRELDGWRGVSILLVVLHHFLVFAFPATVEGSKLLHHVLLYAGEFGVRIFFVISGFVITRLLIIEEREHGVISLKGFYTRRFFRIVPVFYFFVLVVCVLSWFNWTPVNRDWVLAATLFFHDFKLRNFDWFLGHSWSLAVEEQFYLVFPLFWVLFPPRRRASVLFATLAIFLTWSVLGQWGVMANAITASTVVGFSCVNVGALVALYEAGVLRLAARVPLLVVLLVVAFLFGHAVPNTRPAESLYSLAAPFGLALMLTHTVARKGWMSSMLNTKAIQWCGLISYSAYLWQQLFTIPSGYYGSPAAAKAFHLSLLLLPLIAAGSFYWIERPCTRLGRIIAVRFSSREASHVAPVAAS